MPAALRGKCIAAGITHDALLESRRLGWKIVPDSSDTETYIQRHSEFIHLLHKR